MDVIASITVVVVQTLLYSGQGGSNNYSAASCLVCHFLPNNDIFSCNALDILYASLFYSIIMCICNCHSTTELPTFKKRLSSIQRLHASFLHCIFAMETTAILVHNFHVANTIAHTKMVTVSMEK